jgi:hypothetical protein
MGEIRKKINNEMIVNKILNKIESVYLTLLLIDIWK